MESKYFPKILRELMKEQNINQSQLANEIGINQSQVSSYLSGRCLPSYNQIRLISNYFSISADLLCNTNFGD